MEKDADLIIAEAYKETWFFCFKEAVKLVCRQRKIINAYEEKYGKLEIAND